MTSNAVFDGNELVESSLSRMIDWIIEEPDQKAFDFGSLFLNSHLSICSPEELLTELCERYTNVDNVKKTRLLNILKNWFEDYSDLLRMDPQLMTILSNFLPKIQKDSDKKEIEYLIYKAKDEQKSFYIIHRNIETLPTIQDLDSFELAKQLTIIDYKLFEKIKPWELNNQSWSNPEKAPNISRFIKWVNRLTNLFKSVIILESNFKQQQKNLIKVLEVMNHLKNLKNLSGLICVNLAVNSIVVTKLKHLWESVKSSGKLKVNNYEKLTRLSSPEGNFKKLRKLLNNPEPGLKIPYIGMYFQELIYAEERNPKHISDKGLYNCNRLRNIGNIISVIKTLQKSGPASFAEVPFYQEFLNYHPCYSDDIYYDLVKYLEPKGKEIPAKPRLLMSFEERAINQTKTRLLFVGKSNSGKSTIFRIFKPILSKDKEAITEQLLEKTLECMKHFIQLVHEDKDLVPEDLDFIKCTHRTERTLDSQEIIKATFSEDLIRNHRSQSENSPIISKDRSEESSDVRTPSSAIETIDLNPNLQDEEDSLTYRIKLTVNDRKSSKKASHKFKPKIYRSETDKSKERASGRESLESLEDFMESDNFETFFKRNCSAEKKAGANEHVQKIMGDCETTFLAKREKCIEKIEVCIREQTEKLKEEISQYMHDTIENLDTENKGEDVLYLDNLLKFFNQMIDDSIKLKYDPPIDREQNNKSRRSSNTLSKKHIKKKKSREFKQILKTDNSQLLLRSADTIPKIPSEYSNKFLTKSISFKDKNDELHHHNVVHQPSNPEQRKNQFIQQKQKSTEVILNATVLDKDTANTFQQLWETPFYKRAFDKYRFQLPSPFEALFDKLIDFPNETFIPTANELVLYPHAPSSGIAHCDIELKLNDQLLMYTMNDAGGAKNQVNKWYSFLEDETMKVDVIIFVVALDECYLQENEESLEESLKYWKEMTSLPKLSAVPFILLLNKYDRYQYATHHPRTKTFSKSTDDYLTYVIKKFREKFCGCHMMEYDTTAIKIDDVTIKFTNFLKFF